MRLPDILGAGHPPRVSETGATVIRASAVAQEVPLHEQSIRHQLRLECALKVGRAEAVALKTAFRYTSARVPGKRVLVSAEGTR